MILSIHLMEGFQWMDDGYGLTDLPFENAN